MPGSFDLTSGYQGKVASVTVLQAEPWTVGQVPPGFILLYLLIFVVRAAPVCQCHLIWYLLILKVYDH